MRVRWAFTACWSIGLLLASLVLASDGDAWNALMREGQSLADAGNLESAKLKFTEALALARVDPSNQGAVASSLNALGVCLRSLGEHDQAIQHFEGAHAILVRQFGEGQPQTLAPLNNLAGVFRAQGDYGRAGRILERTLAIEQRTYGEGSPKVADTRIRLGNVLTESGELEAAEMHYLAAIAALEADSSSASGSSLSGAVAALGNLYREMGQPERAREMLERAEVLAPTGDGAAPTPQQVAARANLAAARLAGGEYEESLVLLQRVLVEMQEFLPPDHAQFGSVYMNMGVAEANLGRLEPAAANMTKACAIFERALQPDHPDLASCRENRRRVLEMLGQPAD